MTSLAVIALSFLAQLLFRPEEQGLGALRSVWLGVVATWLVVLVAVPVLVGELVGDEL